jgi:hypothetical protein
MTRRHISALAGLLSMGFSLSRESERLAALVRAVAMGERSSTEAHAPHRRVKSASVQSNL